MTPRINLTPWKPNHVIGFAGTWLPIGVAELAAVSDTYMAVLRARTTSAHAHNLKQLRGSRG